MKVWIVGQYRGSTNGHTAWCFQGVFTTEEAALAACRSADYFIAPAMMDVTLPHDKRVWEGARYPRRGKDGAY